MACLSVAHGAGKQEKFLAPQEKFLAPQENLVFPDNRMGFFSSPVCFNPLIEPF